jgi:hypothetical protein
MAIKSSILLISFLSIVLLGATFVQNLQFSKAQSPLTEYQKPELQWTKNYGDNASYYIESGGSIFQTADGGYILAETNYTKYIFRSGYLNPVPLLIKISPQGEVEWIKSYENKTASEHVNSVVQTKDLGYVMFCEDNIIKVDTKGNIKWMNPLGSVYGIQSTDEKIILVNHLYTLSGAYESILTKTDKNGNVLWNRTFSEPTAVNSNSGVDVFSLIETSDGGYVIAGTWKEKNWLAKIDANGNIIQSLTFAFPLERGEEGNKSLMFGTQQITAVSQINEGYLIAGTTSALQFAPYLAKIDFNGNTIWFKEYPQYSELACFLSVLQASNGGFFASGYFANYGLLIRTDQKGALLWENQYPGSSVKTVLLTSMIQTNDGGFAALGINDYSPWLLKFAPEPNISPSPSIPELPTWMILPLSMITVLIAIIIVMRKCSARKYIENGLSVCPNF